MSGNYFVDIFLECFFIDLAFSDKHKIERYSHNYVGKLVVAKSGYLQQGFCVSKEQNRTGHACLGYSAPILFNPREMLGKPASAKIFPRFGVISLEVDGVEVLRVSDTQDQILGALIKFLFLILSSLALLVFAMLRQRRFVLDFGEGDVV